MTTVLIVIIAIAVAALAARAAVLWLRQEFRASAQAALADTQQQWQAQAAASFQATSRESTHALEAASQGVRLTLEPLRHQLDAVTHQQGALAAQVRALHDQTAALTSILGSGADRGRWGEDDLVRVVTRAGLTQGVHFDTQRVFRDGERTLRPDMVVYLATGLSVIIDAKAPMDAYRRLSEAVGDADVEQAGRDHARAVRGHIRALHERSYPRAVPNALSSVVMYLPYEGAIEIAHRYDETLFDAALAAGVHLATPYTLIALLNTVSLGWQHQRLAESAEHIVEIGNRLHDRIAIVAEHAERMGRALASTGAHYDALVGSMERNLLSAAREMHQLGLTSTKPMPDLEPVEVDPRPFVKIDTALRDTA